ncbi:(ZYRO0F02288g) [Zygosaccharomyces parabailii]|uniref:ZYBA0S15-01288g1_1 n=1 Tax=Zygosaccharomyces bailii (strain CLIB 213 / ATCC 58445 / CBS 680 / BCRC 21525 / NBRC 1098 / NCYC 1416 / NRRL Y-2227) TaxID=1333698 RepID=A0A8J2TBM8_ZYGB2|nr:(ZYRO0F02288g) [Zygosaccharomyces parabailii]CDF91906.1 ZYBA0S15-01288g1_1 [Zygosaccharomyces bailii CLIB 213]CDH13867.1 uncharacterized protein ZBAI_05653 [Zygosaccharomyces bailii ISA1307]SJM88454.1 uncharacterized protein ZBIST_4643 [Zygosaccharomyces bailii]
MPYPKVSIVFCLKCKWGLRSAWYLQELLQTFGDQLGEVSLVPGPTGQFKIIGEEKEHLNVIIWDRSVDGGFPDSKYLKQRVKALLFHDEVSIGKHNEKNAVSDQSEQLKTGPDVKERARDNCSDCRDCQDH